MKYLYRLVPKSARSSWLLFMICCTSIMAAQITVTGTILDNNGNTIPGVNVIESGSVNGTISDIDGYFTLNVNGEDAVLKISFIGMESQEIPVANQREFTITMLDAVGMLDEMVVVGYGVQNKATLSGSVETVSGTLLQDRAVSSPALALQGQTPGLLVSRSSSQPGSEGVSMQIRGATSVNGGSPLIIIDGVPITNTESFYSMNPDDIESLSVLKDASASIYGSRAANGVILVTTKKGKGDTKVTVQANVRINTIGIKFPEPTLAEYGQQWVEAYDQDGDYYIDPLFWTRSIVEDMATGREGLYQVNVKGTVEDLYFGDFSAFDKFFGTTVSQEYKIGLSGSGDKSSYRMSMGYSENMGAMKIAYDGKRLYNGRLNYNYKVTDKIKVETGLHYLYTHLSAPSSGATSAVSQDPPIFPAQNPFGQWNANFGSQGGSFNPTSAFVDGGRENTKRDEVRLTVATTWDISEAFSLRASATMDKTFNQSQEYVLTVPQYNWYGEKADKDVNGTSSITKSSKSSSYQNYDAILNYKKNLGSHHFTALTGVTAEKFSYNSVSASRDGFEDEGVYDINLGSVEENVTNSGGGYEWGLLSYIFRANYDYMNKYLLEVNGRCDGSSRFSKENRFSNFGGASAGWVMSEESFMQDVSFLGFLKLRASYGEMGNQVGIGEYDYLSTISTGQRVFGSPANYQNTSYIGSMTSDNRTWERVGIFTTGIDFRMLNNNLYGSFDYFIKNNKGMLVSVVYPEVLGATPPKSNSGELETKGWEVSLGYKGSVGDFRYDVAVNMSDSRNVLTKLSGQDSWSAGKVSAREGYALNSYFLYETNGFFANEEEVAEYYDNYGTIQPISVENTSASYVLSETDGTKSLRPGDTRKVDLDGNGYIDALGGEGDTGDLKYMGDAAAHYIYGLNTSMSYKGFDLSAFFQGVLNQNTLRIGSMSYPNYATYSNQTTAFSGLTWRPDNTDALYPRLTTNSSRAKWNWQNNDFMLQNNRYVRLKSLIIGYTFNDVKITKAKIDRLRIYFSGSDLFEFTSIKDGYDPEYGESSNNFYPFTRSWSFGVNLDF